MGKMILLSELKLNPNNPQIFGDLSKLELNIKEFSKMLELRPLVVDENNMVLGGNKRLVCLRNIGMDEIPEKWVLRAEDLTESEKKRFIISDNTNFGGWDFKKLEEEFADIDLNSIGDFAVSFDGMEEKEKEEPDIDLSDVEGNENRKTYKDDENESKLLLTFNTETYLKAIKKIIQIQNEENLQTKEDVILFLLKIK